MTSLKQFFNKTNLASEDAELFHKIWNKKKMLKAREILMNFNQIDTHLCFIESGCIRLYIISHEGEEVCLGFAYGGTHITCLQTFIHKKSFSTMYRSSVGLCAFSYP